MLKEGNGVRSIRQQPRKNLQNWFKQFSRCDGLVLAQFEKIEDDPETLSLMKSGTLPDPSRKPHETARQLERVVKVKGYRIEHVKGYQIDNDVPLITVFVGVWVYHLTNNLRGFARISGATFELT